MGSSNAVFGVLGETKQWVLLFPLTTVVHSSLVGEFGDCTGVWYDPVCWVPGSSWVFTVGEFPLAVAPSLLGSVGESLFPSLLGSVGGFPAWSWQLPPFKPRLGR